MFVVLPLKIKVCYTVSDVSTRNRLFSTCTLLHVTGGTAHCRFHKKYGYIEVPFLIYHSTAYYNKTNITMISTCNLTMYGMGTILRRMYVNGILTNGRDTGRSASNLLSFLLFVFVFAMYVIVDSYRKGTVTYITTSGYCVYYVCTRNAICILLIVVYTFPFLPVTTHKQTTTQ